ncbi:unnamed protein product [Moneuplotes crassus]|uniref:Uncharacterized protein n=1 Tax=Euplotes crassus TaxID=5936 RepID=A0AAD1Y0W6_EUPCR|nr:unnamed protein product [Moneuplotes crassus]
MYWHLSQRNIISGSSPEIEESSYKGMAFPYHCMWTQARHDLQYINLNNGSYLLGTLPGSYHASQIESFLSCFSNLDVSSIFVIFICKYSFNMSLSKPCGFTSPSVFISKSTCSLLFIPLLILF